MASVVVRGVELVEAQYGRRGLLPDARRAVIGKFDSRRFKRTLQNLSGHARHGFFTLEIAYDENFDAGGGCEAIFAPVEKSAGGAALGGGHGRYIAILRRDRHSGLERLRLFGLAPPQ
jgi:hypothetical protein